MINKIAVLWVMLISMAGLAACVNTHAETADISAEYGMTLKMELDKDYDDTDPFINEQLFCVTEDLDALMAEGTVALNGESIMLEIKNNNTKEVLWSKTWNGNVKSETFSISLEHLKTDDEYVVSLTGRKINDAALEITFDSSLVQKRTRPLR